MNFKIDRKNKVARALVELGNQRAAKKRKMADDEKIIQRALQAWRICIKNITDFRDSLTDSESFENFSSAELRAKLNKIQMLEKNLLDKDIEVNSNTATAGTANEHEEMMKLCEALQSKIHRRISEKTKIEKQEVVSESNLKRAIAAASSEVNKEKVAKIGKKKSEIPNTWGNFTGSVFDWQHFSKEFGEKIHSNADLNDKEKLEILNRACFESARDIITCAGANYQLAWRQLNEMYGETYLTIHYAIHKIQALKVIATPHYEAIKYLWDNGEKCMATLAEKNMAESFGPFLVVMLAAKLDEDSARAWDRHRAVLAESWSKSASEDESRDQSTHVPSWQDFASFLDAECKVFIRQNLRRKMPIDVPQSTQERVSVGAIAGTSGFQNAQSMQNESLMDQAALRPPKPSALEKRSVPIDMQCTLCDLIHMRYNCEVFKAMSLEQRWDHCETDNLCTRCLRKYHGNAPCANKNNNGKCTRCYHMFNKVVYHNSALCAVANGFFDEQPRSDNNQTPDWN